VTGRVLHLAPGLSVPAEQFARSATAFIAKRGSGKSGAVKVTEEELFRVGIPFITFDPVGVHSGIKSSYDGKSAGLPVLVIGGSHGDVRLDRRAGAETCRAILEANVSCVIDFSEEPKSVYRDFVRDFSREFYAKNATPHIVIMEEAPELVPQRFRPDMAETFEAVERLVSRGRNKGIGVILVSQRAATINKDVLTQIDNLFVGRLLSPQDRKALREWIEAWDVKGQEEKFMSELASLPTRTMYLWSPEALKEFKQVRFHDFKTLHRDRTHLDQLGLLESKTVTADVSAVVEKLGKTLTTLAKEKVDAKDVPRLKGEIARLIEENRQLRERPVKVTEKVVIDDRAIERAVVAERRRYTDLIGRMDRAFGEITSAAARGVKAHTEFNMGTPPDIRRGTPKVLTPEQWIRRVGGTMMAPDDGTSHLYSGEKKILGELGSRHPLKLTRAQLATLVGMSVRGGTFTTYIGRLKRFGFLNEQNREVTITGEGMAAAGEIPAAPSTREEVMKRWSQSLYSGCYRLLEIVTENPEGISRTDLADRGQMVVTGGTFTTYLGILKRNQLVVEEDHLLKPGPGLSL
jgi:uncharacterized protein